LTTTTFDAGIIIIFCVGIFLRVHSKIENHEKSKLIKKLEGDIDLLNYKEISFLDYKGLSTGGGAGGLRQATAISPLLENVVTIDNGYSVKTDKNAETIYQNIIQKQPDFPFAYYYLAMSQRKRNDEEWKPNAQKALKILNQTTKIDNHFVHHDEAKKDILSWYNEK